MRIMSKTRTPDQRAETRRRVLSAFCKRKGWRHQDGSWAIKEIAKFFGKHHNKVSDLLNGRGSFGSQIARDLEAASGGELAEFELDGPTSEVSAPADPADAQFLAQLQSEVGQRQLAPEVRSVILQLVTSSPPKKGK
jgi:hypothetical protein